MSVPRDPGLQPERTALAWTRTALALVANALLVVRTGLQGGNRLVVIVGLAITCVAIALTSVGARRQRQLATRGRSAPSVRLVGLMSASVLLVAVLAAIAVLR